MNKSYLKQFTSILLVFLLCLFSSCQKATSTDSNEKSPTYVLRDSEISTKASNNSVENTKSTVWNTSKTTFPLSDTEQTKLYDEFIFQAINGGNYGDGVEAGWFETSKDDEKLYAYYDIDSNGVKELLLGEDGCVLTDGRSGKIVQHIYTISSGKVERQDFFGFFAETDYDIPVILSNGLVKCGGPTSEGNVHYSYFKFNNGTLERVCSFNYWLDSDSSYTETKDGETKNISKSEYIESVEKLEADSENVDIDAFEWHNMTDFLEKASVTP